MEGSLTGYDYALLAQKLVRDAGVLSVVDPSEGEGSLENAFTFMFHGPHSLLRERKIVAERPHSLKTLAIFSHEAGHIATTPAHEQKPDRAGRIMDELGASKWGVEAIRKHLGYVPDQVQEDMRKALSSYTSPDEPVPAEAAAFLAGGSL